MLHASKIVFLGVATHYNIYNKQVIFTGTWPKWETFSKKVTNSVLALYWMTSKEKMVD